MVSSVWRCDVVSSQGMNEGMSRSSPSRSLCLEAEVGQASVDVGGSKFEFILVLAGRFGEVEIGGDIHSWPNNLAIWAR